MSQLEDKSYPLNTVTREETPRGTFEVRWVIEGDGGANGFDQHNARWEGMWTGTDVIEARRL